MKVEKNQLSGTNFGALHIKGPKNSFMKSVMPELEKLANDADIYIWSKHPFGKGFDIGADKIVKSPIRRLLRFIIKDMPFRKLRFDNQSITDEQKAQMLIENVKEVKKEFTDFKAYFSQ